MANIFDISGFTGTITGAKDKAIAMAGEFGLNDLFGGHVLPTTPPYPQGADIDIAKSSFPDVDAVNQADYQTSIFGTPMCFPLKIKLSGQSEKEWWSLPLEPMITINGGNTLIRRNVSKSNMRGSMKERWSQNDYDISIEGVFTKKDDWSFPEQDVKRLIAMMETKESLDVESDLFEFFHIDRMVVEDFDFPFTKGVENQGYKLRGYSDDNWNLFLDSNGKPALSS